MKYTELVTSDAADRFHSAPTLFSEDVLRNQLAEIVLASPAVPARRDQQAALAPILDAFFEGLGTKAAEVLSANLEGAGARLVRLVEQEQRRFMPKPPYDEVVEMKEFNPPRATDKPVSADRYGSFVRSTAYEGWRRSLFALEWFDSRTERTVANIVDTDDGVTCWVRLHTGELPILWSSGGQQYNPDFIVLETDGTHWVVEVKMNKEMTSADVLGKREAAMRWANTVTANECVSVIWRYLLVSESDIDDAKGSWPALKKLGS
jgi:type III restriction enzyme